MYVVGGGFVDLVVSEMSMTLEFVICPSISNIDVVVVVITREQMNTSVSNKCRLYQAINE